MKETTHRLNTFGFTSFHKRMGLIFLFLVLVSVSLMIGVDQNVNLQNLLKLDPAFGRSSGSAVFREPSQLC